MGTEFHKYLSDFTSVMNGIDLLSDAVKITLGPKGRNAIYSEIYTKPKIINDGAMISTPIEFADVFENMGAQLIKEVAEKTKDSVGDGSTTAVVLAQAMIQEGKKNITAGANPIMLRKGIERAVNFALNELGSLALPVTNDNDIRRVVYSSSNDHEMADLIAHAFLEVSDINSIVIESSQTTASYLDIEQGFSFDRGYLSAQMINDKTVGHCVLEDADILIYDKKFSTTNDIYPVLELALNRKKPLLLIADDIEKEALQILNLNNSRGLLSIVVVQGPTHGENRINELKDIETLIGGRALTGPLLSTVDKLTEDMLGHAERVVVDKDKTSIIGGMTNQDEIDHRIAIIREEMEQYNSEFATQVCQNRLSRLAGKTVVIKIGASTETEYSERKSRANDALHAASAALKEGIICGGGVSYLRLEETLGDLLNKENDVDVITGISLVSKALSRPLAQIALNAGKDASVVVETVRKLPENHGYNVISDRYEDLFFSGVIDPVMVVKSALQNAGSIAATLLSSGMFVANKKE